MEQAKFWNEKVHILSGISAKRVDQLKKLQIETVGDLASHFPRRYEDWTSLLSIAELEDGSDGVFLAQVANAPSIFRKGKRSILQCSLRDPSGSIRAMWFNQPYLQDKLELYAIYLFRGRIKRQGRTFSIANPAFELQEGAEFPVGGLSLAQEVANTFVRPVYPSTQGLSQNMIRKFVDAALDKVKDEIEESLPIAVRRAYQLADRQWAYFQIHHPDQLENYKIARRRLAFDELLYTQLGLRLSKNEQMRKPANPLRLAENPDAQKKIKEFIRNLSFELTTDQKKALRDVLHDMEQSVAMNRLLQGDVGSGKTIVAFIAMYAQYLTGKQSVLMAPTAILAHQHWLNFQKFFPFIGEEEVACLTGKQTAAEKKKIYSRLEAGEIRFLIGTHALIQKPVRFESLALAVTDEQHRFGVKQRLDLIEEEETHVLVMSATPIPRTLGLVLYGDLDVSVIREKPPGRQPVQTYTAKTKDLPRIWNLCRRFVQNKEQVYIVCPMVNESELIDLQSAVNLYDRLSNHEFKDLQVALLHGQMKEKEKTGIMEAFLAKETDILISTTVIEVGVDNPNASFMLIMNAERFGIAQLHQLRGRIGRGSQQALCVLQSDVTEGTARERLVALCKSEDGFEIAEADLRLRGPGDFFGTRQHGLPSFRVANLYEDQELLSSSAELSARILHEDPNLESAAYRKLKNSIQQFLQRREA